MSGGPITRHGKTQFSSASEVTDALKKNVIVSYYNNNQSSQKSVPGSLYTSFKGGAANMYGSPVNVSGYVPSTSIGYYSYNVTEGPQRYAPWSYVTISMATASGTTDTYVQRIYNLSSPANPTNGRVYSTTGYISNVYCSTIYHSDRYFAYGFFGLSRNPSGAGNNGNSLDYGFCFNGKNDVHVIELGVTKTDPINNWGYDGSDTFSITYDGSNVNYYYTSNYAFNTDPASNIRTVAVAPGSPLYLYAIPSYYGSQNYFSNITLGPFGLATITVTASYTYTNNFVQSGVLGEKATPNMNVASKAVINNPQ